MSMTLVLGAALLVKSAYSGFTMPQYTYSLVCEIHADHVNITRGFGGGGENGLSFTTSKPIVLDGDVGALVAKANAETIDAQPTPCDGPSDDLRGFAPGLVDAVIIKASGGCGTPSTDRTGPASTVIKNLVDALCPKP